MNISKNSNIWAFLSGASVKINFLAGVSLNLIQHHGLIFNGYVGISSGAILSLPFAMGLFEPVKQKLENMQVSDFMRYDPESLQGKFHALLNVLDGNIHLFDQSKLEITLKEFIDKNDFDDWRKSTNTPEAYVGAVCVETGEKRYVNLKQCEYKTAIKWIMASASLPFFTEHIEIDGCNWHDGGTRDHIGTSHFMEQDVFNSQIDEVHSVFARPKDLKDAQWEYPVKQGTFGSVWLLCFLAFYSFDSIMPIYHVMVNKVLGLFCLYKSFASVKIQKIIFRIVEIMSFEISKSDEKEALLLCEKHNVKHYTYFTPYKLSNIDNNYTTGKEQNLAWFEMGVKESNRVYMNN